MIMYYYIVNFEDFSPKAIVFYTLPNNPKACKYLYYTLFTINNVVFFFKSDLQRNDCAIGPLYHMWNLYLM